VAGSSPAAGSRLKVINNHMIPKHAKKVFHGTVFHVYQWEQQMFNQTTKIFEVAKRLDGVSIIATHEDKIIVLTQKQPGTKTYHSIPGGYMDHEGESPKQTALRELMEETGMKPKSIKLWKKFPRGGRLDSTHYLFIAKDCKKVGEQSLDGGEIIDIHFWDFDKFLQLSDVEDFHNHDVIIELLRARLHKNIYKELRNNILGK
jgi:ADP-ribose pyrophosphatase YjhB (NUDIX family)